MIAMKLFNTV